MARVYEIGTHLLAVVDVGDALTDPKRLVVARVIMRDGTTYDEFTDVARCAELLGHLRTHGTRVFPLECDALPLKRGPRCDEIMEVRVWAKQWVMPLGNGGYSCYFPKGRIVWSRWGALVRSLRRDLALHRHMPLMASEFALLVGEKLDGRTVAAWLANEQVSAYHYQPQLLWLRIVVDAMRHYWILTDRHSPAWQFVRGNLPETETPVLALLKTDEGAAKVMDYIASTGDPQFLRERQSPRALH